MTFLPLIRQLKGGEGSGNFGHSGRPGKIGGSSIGTGFGNYDNVPQDPVMGRAYFIRLDTMDIIPLHAGEEHYEKLSREPGMFGLTQDIVNTSNPDELLKKSAGNYVQVRVLSGSTKRAGTSITGLPVNTKNLRVLQDMALAGKLPQHGKYDWEDWNGNYITDNYDEFMNAKYIVSDKSGYMTLKAKLD